MNLELKSINREIKENKKGLKMSENDIEEEMKDAWEKLGLSKTTFKMKIP